MSTSIRKARYEDVNDLSKIHYQAWMSTYVGLIPDDFLATRSEENSRKIFENSYRSSFVYIVNNKIVGFVSIGFPIDRDIEGNSCLIHGLYFYEKYQNKGYGSELIDHIKEYLRNEGYTVIGLWVVQGNIKAINFYEKNNFTFTGATKVAVLIKPVTALFYELDLNV